MIKSKRETKLQKLKNKSWFEGLKQAEEDFKRHDYAYMKEQRSKWQGLAVLSANPITISYYHGYSDYTQHYWKLEK